MNKLDELISKREDEISNEKLAIRKDKDNLNDSILSGIWGVFVGAFYGFLFGLGFMLLLTIVILPIYSWSKFGLGAPKGDGTWQTVLLILSIVIGAIVGYYVFFDEKRKG